MTSASPPAAPAPGPNDRQGERPGLALFDFDGTLTRHDTVLPFLFSFCDVRTLPRIGTTATTTLLRERQLSRNAAKAAIVAGALRGRTRAEVDAAGREYARTLVRNALRVDSRARLEWHRTQGHSVVIVSASLEPYLPAVAEQLGVATCLCTRLEADEHGVLTGAIAGANCRGDEKARRVLEVLDPSEYEVWAYGDTQGDRAMLALADHPVWVRPRIPGPIRITIS